MTTTRKLTKEKIDAMITKLQSIELTAIELGMLYQNSDAIVSGVMYAISKMVETAIPLLEQTNKEL